MRHGRDALWDVSVSPGGTDHYERKVDCRSVLRGKPRGHHGIRSVSPSFPFVHPLHHHTPPTLLARGRADGSQWWLTTRNPVHKLRRHGVKIVDTFPLVVSWTDLRNTLLVYPISPTSSVCVSTGCPLNYHCREVESCRRSRNLGREDPFDTSESW